MTTSAARACLALVLLATLGAGCSSSDDCAPRATIAVLGAMPSELAPLLARATVRETRVIDGRAFHVGELGGVPVVLAMTGIGMVNSAETTRLLLDRFTVSGVVFSGVAGSPHRIADVTVPLSWSEPGGPSHPCDEDWIAAALRAADDGAAGLERCTPYPLDAPDAAEVCLPFAPTVVVSGRGESADPFRGARVGCEPGGNDVFGCDPALAAVASLGGAAASAGFAPHAQADELTVDMETAAAAREAAARGVRFIAFRAVSDGAADPLGLPGFPAQFFAYYRLAATNAAIAATAFLEELASPAASDDPFCS
jgi:nucleoside phosphorylase